MRTTHILNAVIQLRKLISYLRSLPILHNHSSKFRLFNRNVKVKHSNADNKSTESQRIHWDYWNINFGQNHHNCEHFHEAFHQVVFNGVGLCCREAFFVVWLPLNAVWLFDANELNSKYYWKFLFISHWSYEIHLKPLEMSFKANNFNFNEKLPSKY